MCKPWQREDQAHSGLERSRVFSWAGLHAGLVCHACWLNGRWNFVHVSELGTGKDNFLSVVLQQSASFEQAAF